MLRIKLQKAGKKNQPFFKMVVIERKSPPKGGRPVDVVGFYNPLTKEKGLEEEKIKHWLSVGAQPSDVVHNMLITASIIEGDKIDVHKKAKTKEEPARAVAKTATIESLPESSGENPAGQAETETQKTAVEASAETQAVPKGGPLRQDEDEASDPRPEDSGREQEAEKVETSEPEEEKIEEVKPEQEDSGIEPGKQEKLESKEKGEILDKKE